MCLPPKHQPGLSNDVAPGERAGLPGSSQKGRPFCRGQNIRSSAWPANVKEKLVVTRKTAAALVAECTALALMMPKNACVPNRRHQLWPMKCTSRGSFALLEGDEDVGVRGALSDSRSLCRHEKRVKSSTRLLALEATTLQTASGFDETVAHDNRMQDACSPCRMYWFLRRSSGVRQDWLGSDSAKSQDSGLQTSKSVW